MNTNEYGQVSFSNNEIINMLYSGQSIKDCIVNSIDIEKHKNFADYFDIQHLDKANIIQEDPTTYHKHKSNEWNMPQEYKDMDIEKFLANRLVSKNLISDIYTQRLTDEILEFQSRNMLNILKFLCYLMNTCQQHNIVTGIGRGSSVSSLVLHLLDVHQIDPVKYNLDYKEFLR